MRFSFKPMGQAEADIIADWHYDGVYSFYDMVADQEDLEEFLSQEERGDKYFSVYQNKELAGFFCFEQIDFDAIDIGLGMNPGFTGHGKGLNFVQSGMDFAKERYSPQTFTLSVATFNQRAIIVYERAGFKPLHTFIQETNGGQFEFLKMKCAI